MEIVIALFVVAFIVIVVVGILQSAKRRKELTEWARANGLRFSPDTNYEIEGRFGSFPCLKEGGGRYAYNVSEGRYRNRPICAFDYHYEKTSTDSEGKTQTSHYYFSAAVVETHLALKPLFIRSEGFLDKVAEFLGFNDIDFESSEFSRQFYVKAPDRRWAYDVLTQETMEFLLQAPRFVLDFEGSRVMAYRHTTFSTADFSAALEVVAGIIDRLPRSVLRELKGGRT